MTYRGNSQEAEPMVWCSYVVSNPRVSHFYKGRLAILLQKSLELQAATFTLIEQQLLTMKSFGIDLFAYGEMPTTSLNYFRAMMESRSPELRLCEDHWKANMVWKENFSSWGQPGGRQEGRGTSSQPGVDPNGPMSPQPPMRTQANYRRRRKL